MGTAKKLMIKNYKNYSGDPNTGTIRISHNILEGSPLPEKS